MRRKKSPAFFKKKKKVLFAKLNSGYLRNLSRQTSDRK